MDQLYENNLSNLILKITTQTEDILEEDIESLKNYLKLSKNYFLLSYDMIFQQMKSDSSTVRLQSYKVMSLLIGKSKVIRLCIMRDIKIILKIVMPVDDNLYTRDHDMLVLENLMVSDIKEWCMKYPEMYRLRQTYSFVKSKGWGKNQLIDQSLVKRVDVRQEEKRVEFSDLLERNIVDQLTVIEESLQKMKSCFKDLFPDFMANNGVLEIDDDLMDCDFDDVEFEDVEFADEDSIMGVNEIINAFGLGSANYTLTIELNTKDEKLDQTKENSSMIQKIIYLSKLNKRFIRFFHRILFLIKKNNLIELQRTYRCKIDEIYERIIILQNKCVEFGLCEKMSDVYLVQLPDQLNDIGTDIQK